MRVCFLASDQQIFTQIFCCGTNEGGLPSPLYKGSGLAISGGTGTLTYRMDMDIKTGSTRSPRSVLLACTEEKSLQAERVLMLFEIHGDENQAKTVRRECENVLKHALLETDGNAAERLDGALKELNGLLKGMLVSGAIEDLHLLIAVLEEGGMLHVSHAGRSEAYLVRKGLASQITEYTSGKSIPAFVHISSGALQKNDIVILSTQRLLRSLTPAQMAGLPKKGEPIDALIRALDAEGEHAAIATIVLDGVLTLPLGDDEPAEAPRQRPVRRRSGSDNIVQAYAEKAMTFIQSLPLGTLVEKLRPTPKPRGVKNAIEKGWNTAKDWFSGLMVDLRDPKRKKRAHLLLIALAIASIVIVWMLVNLLLFSQRNKSQAELTALMKTINEQIQTAENRRIIGDLAAANGILAQAEEAAHQVTDNESGLFRSEALDLLDKIRAKKEELNNIVTVTPRVVANVATKNASVVAKGLIGLRDGEFVAFDAQNLYRVLLNTVDDPSKLPEGDELIAAGASFVRFNTLVFLVTGNVVMEWNNDAPTTMKTEDPAGWVTGFAAETYLRYLYVLAPDRTTSGKNQIYKYERLQDRYGPPASYNLNGDLTGAIDLAIDGNVYILKEGGGIVKLFRGESQPFQVRQAPENLLVNATKIFKVQDGNFYILDPKDKRIIVLADGGASGEATYLRQYVIKTEQLGQLQDLYIDPDQAHLYAMDEKRIYIIDMNQQGERETVPTRTTSSAPTN